MSRQPPCSSPIPAKRFKMAKSKENIIVNITPNSDKLAEISARSYQTELMEQAKSENLIICLPTGSGKTYIAVMLIKEMSKPLRDSLKKGGKRTIFLVKTVQLSIQQSDYIRTHTDLTVDSYYGEKGVDFWLKDKWDIEFEKNQVLVFTAQVFLNIITHGYFSLNQVNLIIFDECHHATGENQYAALMNKHYDYCSSPPRVLGLTASITNKKIKPKDLVATSKELERTYRAHIECGSNRSESVKYGTSAHVETISYSSYQDIALKTNESLTIPFHFLRYMISIIQNYLSETRDKQNKIETDLSRTILTSDYRGKDFVTYQNQSGEYTESTHSQSPMLVNIKRYLENLIEIGHELGLLGLFLLAKDLRKKLKDNQYHLMFINLKLREIYQDVFQRLECLVDDILKNLYKLNQNEFEILFSPKVFKLLERIIQQQNTENTNGRCIVFVERVYTAKILSEVLSVLIFCAQPPWNTYLKVKYVAGINSMFNASATAGKCQREVIKEFRNASINILIATAVVEEGLDIPQCDLVIRFNKPHNFSSYMQSKGRARAKQNASYVLFMDELNAEANQRDRLEYDNYEEIEKMIQHGLSLDDNEDVMDDDLAQILPYRLSNGVVIDATRAAQLIMDYCILLGNGQIFPPRFLFHGYTKPYTCILSMPANCPIRDDIIGKGNNKKLAKYQCCLEMVKKLHKEGEFNEYCLPNQNRTLLQIETPIEIRIFKLCDELFEKKTDSSIEIVPKQIARFPTTSDVSEKNWYLYQINNELGFITPCESIKIPKFHIYGENEIIKVLYVKPINYGLYRNELEEFCRYLFEYVFEDMNTNSILQFNMTNSTFKLLPCLLTKYGDIDLNRMKMICQRKNKSVKSHSELNDDELYWPATLSKSHLFRNLSDRSLLKRPTDAWDHKTNSKNIKTYADYFVYKYPKLSFRQDSYLVTMKGVKKLKINYLKEPSKINRDKTADDSNREVLYYPIEYLRYGPLNQKDMELIYKLPSILIRISQLYRTEKLRKLFADNSESYSFRDADQMPVVTFNDCLKNNNNPSFLPLISLTYDNIPTNTSTLQPSPNILFQAITRRSTDENLDMENLEILGDCFLKLAVSMCLYHRYPLVGAGVLTVEKAKQISNGNLYRIAVQKQLKSYLNAVKTDFRGEKANWLPPGYTIPDLERLNSDEEFNLKRYKHQTVKRKAVADMIEAFIGAYLVSTNYFLTIEFMKWLGLDVMPSEKKIPSILCPSIDEQQAGRIVEKFYKEQAFDDIEQIINYRFDNKAYLIAAFTHPSNFANRLTNCYERLEFLGDAVLDFLVTRQIFIEDKNIAPGRVTDIRQDLANNGRLAYIFVACGLHKKILHNSPDLFGQISSYAGDEETFPKDVSFDIQLSKDIDQWADSTAPKALADVFEALVGAIFLDSGKCLKTVWEVIEPLLRQYIHRSITDTNFNPIRTFFEEGGKVDCEFIETDPKTEVKTSVCIVEAPNGYQFKGCGVNRKMAKYDACRRANNFKIN